MAKRRDPRPRRGKDAGTPGARPASDAPSPGAAPASAAPASAGPPPTASPADGPRDAVPPPTASPADTAVPSPLPTATARPAGGDAGGAAATRGWWWTELTWARWVAFRVCFFGLLAVDAFLQLPHAPRYGAGGFNVPHLSWLPLPEPGRVSITFVHAALCLLFALVAQGALVRVALPLATALYGWAYFSSQLDSYQHHYLMWLVLVVLCFAPRAPAPPPAGAAATAPRRVSTWVVRLLLVQVGVVYLWAGIAKIDPLWLDGSALFVQVKDGAIRDLIAGVGFDRVAVLVLAAELFLAVAVWLRRLWLPALAAGVGLHVGIELVGLEIGLFSYLMFAIYLLLVPDAWFVAAARPLAAARRRATAALGARTAVLRLAGWPLALAAVVALLVVVPLPFGAAVALLVALAVTGGAAALVGSRPGAAARLGWAVAVAAALPLALHTSTDVASDYYRYWAGSARRLGDEADARRAYRGLLAVDPSSEYAHFHLGKQEAGAGRHERALDHFARAQRAAPGRGRAHFAEAEVRLRQNDPEAARAALRAGLEREPDHVQAQRLLQDLGGSFTPPTRPPRDGAPTGGGGASDGDEDP